MNPLNTDIKIDYKTAYLHMKRNKDVDSISFHFVDIHNNHIDGYWLFKIDDNKLDRFIEVGTNVRRSCVDTHINDNAGRLKIVGVDEL